MPVMQISSDTMVRVRAARPAGFELSGLLLRLDDGSWLISVTDEIAVAIVTERVRGASDDGVVPRILMANGAASIRGKNPCGILRGSNLQR